MHIPCFHWARAEAGDTLRNCPVVIIQAGHRNIRFVLTDCGRSFDISSSQRVVFKIKISKRLKNRSRAYQKTCCSRYMGCTIFGHDMSVMQILWSFFWSISQELYSRLLLCSFSVQNPIYLATLLAVCWILCK